MELCVFLAFLTTFLLCIVLRPLAFRLNLIDHPDERRLHSHPAQLTGGMSIVISMLLIMLFANHMGLIQKTNLLPSLFLMMMLGLLDDLYRLKFHQIITLQIFIGLVMIFNGGYHVEHLGKLLGEFDIHTQSLMFPITLISIVGVQNAMNMIDGQDGLAGSVTFISTAWYLLLAILVNNQSVIFTSTILMATLVAFLCFNFRIATDRNANVFLGSNGSMPLGLILTWQAIELSGSLSSPVTPITAVWIIALPLMDMVRLMILRSFNGQHMMLADRRHVHHILEQSGFSKGQSLMILILISLLLGSVGVLGWWLDVPEWIMFFGFIGLLTVYVVLLERLASKFGDIG